MRIQRGPPSSPEAVKSCCNLCTTVVYPGEEMTPLLAKGLFSFGDDAFDLSPGACLPLPRPARSHVRCHAARDVTQTRN